MKFGASEANAQASQAGNEYERKGYAADKRYRHYIEDGSNEWSWVGAGVAFREDDFYPDEDEPV